MSIVKMREKEFMNLIPRIAEEPSKIWLTTSRVSDKNWLLEALNEKISPSKNILTMNCPQSIMEGIRLANKKMDADLASEKMDKYMHTLYAGIFDDEFNKLLMRREEDMTNEEKDILRNNLTGNKELKDSGNRTIFEGGALRDISEENGRCDLLPLDVFTSPAILSFSTADSLVLDCIDQFKTYGKPDYLLNILAYLAASAQSIANMMLDLSKHYGKCLSKYPENNWKKGIPAKSFIDSATRHYLKHMRGDKDEDHYIAFIWNIVGCIWTCKYKPELNDYYKESDGVDVKNV